jgi:hypothetical protein
MLAIACRAWKELNHPAPTNRPAVGIWYDFHCRRPRGFFIFGRIRLLAASRDAEKEILVLSEICSDMSKAPKDGKILGHFQKAPPVEEIWWDQEKDGGQGAWVMRSLTGKPVKVGYRRGQTLGWSEVC